MTKIYLTALFLLLSLISRGQDIEFEEIKFEHLDLRAFNKETVITSSEEYEAMLKNCLPASDFNSRNFPEIDFYKKVLLGSSVPGMDCKDPKFDIRVFKSENDVIFNVDVTEHGNCRALLLKIIWITIPRKFTEQVVFVTNRKKSEG